MSDAALSKLRTLLEQRHGIGERSGGWVTSRLQHAFDAISREAGGPDAALDLLRIDALRLAELAECLRVGETRFYRDPEQWTALTRHCRERFFATGRVRGLSVGCSNGQEALTLAMLLDQERDAAGLGSMSLRVVGIDKSEQAIETARDGLYSEAELAPLPRDLRARYFTPTEQGVRIDEGLRKWVSFSVRDALSGPPPGLWEVVICKNVLIYLSDDAAERVVAQLLRALGDDGVLLLARSDVPRVRALGHRADELAPGVTVFRAG
ncbi:MAG: CheR family methyltransferase [Polyangiaceae bacterium]